MKENIFKLKKNNKIRKLIFNEEMEQDANQDVIVGPKSEILGKSSIMFDYLEERLYLLFLN